VKGNNRSRQTFHVISGEQVRRVIFADIESTLSVIRDAYRAHYAGSTVNPDSFFLRFSSDSNNRIIALPAHLEYSNGDSSTGIKWISSFPGNKGLGFARASAVIILNDGDNGYPRVCMEGSTISAARTAASAVLAARMLLKGQSVRSMGLIGCGVIGEYIIRFLLSTGWSIASLCVHDQIRTYAQELIGKFATEFPEGVSIEATAESVIRRCDLVVFATTAASPHIHSVSTFEHNPLVLHISLRDLAPQIILASHNVVDDIDHCLKANTSAHLTEQLTGTRSFIEFTLPQILAGSSVPDRTKPIVFSPFGMGILDIALAQRVYDLAEADGSLIPIPDFFI
jgi:N-[(2S)-2-amino-2-carboxyethyl]-L-glutamate dehydrogenase